MRKFKKFRLLLSICLTLSIILGNFSLPVLAFEIRTKILSDSNGVDFDKIKSLPNQDNGLPQYSLITKKENAGLKRVKEKRKDYVEGEILVKYKNNRINLETSYGRTIALNFVRTKSLEEKEDLRKNNISVLRIKDAKTVEEKIAELKNDPNVEYVQPNFQYYPLSINTDDTFKANLWGLDNSGQSVNGVSGTADADIDAPEAWAINEGTNGQIIVAVIDTGVAFNHPDLLANMWDGTACVSDTNTVLGNCIHGYDFEGSGDKIPLPTNSSHGTHIAGTIVAVKNNNKGIIGVAPNAKIMALKSSLTTAENVKAINFAKYNGAKIINASWGRGLTTCADAYDAFLYTAIQDFEGLFIAAAGNASKNHDGSTYFHRPSDYGHTTTCWSALSNVVSVAATDQNDILATFSDYGATSVDVGAPGTNIYSTGFLEELFTNATLPSFTNTLFTKTSGGWRTDTWDGVDKMAVSNSSYLDNDDGALVLNVPQDTTIHGGDVWLEFYLYADIEFSPSCSYDYLSIQVDNNDNNWVEKSRRCGTIVGQQEVNLGTGKLNMRIRFVWHTDGSMRGSRVPIIDDISISNTNSYQYMQGTSMAAPHVAGLAALVWGYKPGLNYTEVKNTILTTGNVTPSLVGKTVTGKRINAYNALNSLSEKKPPYAVAIDNQKNARPISGINEADVVYEFPVEGSITRFMAMYNPNSGIDPSVKIGPVRSARSYFARTASEHNAIYAHAGGTADALQKLSRYEYKVYNLDALTTEGGSYFWRDNNRAMPHNLYTSIERLNNYRENIHLTGGSFSQPWIFSNNPSSIDLVGYNRNEIDVNYDDVNYNVKWKYNSVDGFYYRQTYENGSYQNYIDANGNWVSTKNLAVQYAMTDSFTELSQTNGDALLCRGGKCVSGLWRKDTTDSNVKFYVKSNNVEFEFKTGKLWINVTNHGPVANYTISGTIKYYDGVKTVPNATVILENGVGTEIATTTTDANGVYQFNNLTNGGDYVVRVSKSDNASGLTGADQTKIRRHIVGLELFDTIYKIIAGDANKSGGLTGADQTKIRRFIVGLDTSLSAGVWTFYSSSATLTAANYLTVGLTRTYTNVTADMINQDFVGIKMGDVNNSWVNN